MAKTSRIMAFWDSFQKSSEYKIINNYPQWLVQETVQYFDKMMAKIYPGSFRTWNEDKLLDVLYMMLDQADDERQNDVSGGKHQQIADDLHGRGDDGVGYVGIHRGLSPAEGLV